VTLETLLLLSFLAGLVGAMAGMGGGVVLIPALTLAGEDIKRAIAVSTVSVIATSSGAASAYVRDHVTNLRVGMFLEMFTIVGAIVGASITVASNGRWLYVVFGLVLLASWAALWVQRGRPWEPPASQDAFSRWLELEGEYPDHVLGRTVAYRATRAAIGAPCMFGAGIIAGLLGIGAGALKVLIHDLVMGLPPKVSTTTSNLIIGVTALAGTSVYLASGLLDTGLAAPVIVGVTAGAFAGTRVLLRTSNETVHRFFRVVLLILGAEMIVRGLRSGG
jgi:uncharacterized membrane protein YfcA